MSDTPEKKPELPSKEIKPAPLAPIITPTKATAAVAQKKDYQEALRATYSSECDQLFAAIAKASGEVEDLVTDSKVAFTHKGKEVAYDYASLPGLQKLLKPVLAANNLAIMVLPQGSYLEVVLAHGSGQRLTFFVDRRLSESESGRRAWGGSITYARRYILASVFGLAADADVDAEADDRSNVTVVRRERK